jgi:predicted Zn-dependent protease
MRNSVRSWQGGRAFWVMLLFAAVLFCAGALNAYAQGCPTLLSPNRGWAQNTIVRYAFDTGFTDEQKRQIRAAAAEWNRANSLNNSKVSFVEDTSGTNFTLKFLIGTLGAGNPAVYNATYDGATFTIKSATITYDPNNTFPGSAQLVADPNLPGYSTMVMKLVLHEMGHTMGLDHPFVPADPCDQPDGATVMNFACGINDQGNNLPTTVSSCDQSTLNSESIYPPINLPPPTIQLSATSYSVSEGQSFAALTVTRSGDTTAPATVKYATSDSTDVNFRCDPTTAGQPTGIASRKCDYHITVGRLRFAAGETSKQIAVSLIDDVYVEGPETFTITLSNPTGATLGANTTATITITDNDTGGAANPIDGTRFFVRQLYVDLLSREPDPAGWDGWTSRIDLCGQPGQAPGPCDRVTVGGDGFLRSAEFFDRQFFVVRLYRTGLGRILQYSEVGDLAYVSGFLSSNDLELNKQELVADIMSRSEFANRYNGLSNLSYVDTLLQTAGVTVPQAVHDNWVTSLNAGSKTRAQVYREISERQEVVDKYTHEAQVISAYYGFFTRNPDAAYFDFLRRLDSGEINQADLANAFINAAEYRQRFGPN